MGELVSVVVPMFNEESTTRELYRRVSAALAGEAFELVAVDDGSTDATPAVLAELADADPRVKVVALSRNFGHQTALSAGLDHAAGAAVVMMDADLQDPPELIPAMLARWRDGSDVVYAVRTSREGETRFKRATARLFYRVLAKLSDVRLPPDAGDFRLLDRRAVDALLAMPERNRYLRGMTVWVGFTQTAIPYARAPRHAGTSRYPLRRMLRLSLDAISSFSHAPLQVATIMGFLCAALAFLAIPVAVGFRIAGEFVPGITTTVIAVLLLGGIQLIALGVIGEYVGRIYDEVKRRPLYFVRERRNLDDRPADERADARVSETR
ncbi:MAG TPA: glycosyltransferase family 2 protein [Solirubrobacteraceae bacterium]|nr:glycosyltransferase family 2 protein [Solirubrobacteraceae bacterium]